MILLATDLDKSFLSQQFTQIVTQLLADEPIEYEGVDVRLKLRPDSQLTARKQSLYVDIPLDLEVAKSAGLFSLEAQGSIMLSITTKLNIDEQLNLSTSSNIEGWKWIVEPKVKVGMLSIPAKTIADLILNRVDERLTNQLVEQIKNKLNLQSIINQQLAKIIDSKKILDQPELYVRVQPRQVQCAGFKEYGDKIQLPLYLEMDAELGDEFKQSTDWKVPDFAWQEIEPLEYEQTISSEIGYDTIEKLILDQVDGLEVGGKTIGAKAVSIEYSDKLNIQIEITSPITSRLEVIAKPRYESGTLHMDDLQVEMHTSNILYKMTSPIIESLIRNELNDRLPISLSDILQQQIRNGLAESQKLKGIHIALNEQEAEIQSIDWKSQALAISLRAKDLAVVVQLAEIES